MNALPEISIQPPRYSPPDYIQHQDVEPCWQEILEKQKQDVFSPSLYNGPLYHYVGTDDARQVIQVQEGLFYKQVIGLRNNPDWMRQHKYDTETPRALSLFLLIVTQDDYQVLKKRTGGDWVDSFEVPGGFITGEHGSVEQAMVDLAKRNYETVDYCSHQIEWLGHFDNPNILEHPLVFRINISQTAQEFENQEPDVLCIPYPNTGINCERLQTLDLPFHPPTEALFRYLLSLDQSRRHDK